MRGGGDKRGRQGRSERGGRERREREGKRQKFIAHIHILITEFLFLPGQEK
jgi:hypothetical protein